MFPLRKLRKAYRVRDLARYSEHGAYVDDEPTTEAGSMSLSVDGDGDAELCSAREVAIISARPKVVTLGRNTVPSSRLSGRLAGVPRFVLFTPPLSKGQNQC